MFTKTFFRISLLDSGPNAQMRFAGPRATSQWVVLPVIALLSLNASSITEQDTVEILTLRVFADLAAFLVAWVLFTSCGLLVGRFFNAYGLPRMLALALLYAVTEISRTTTGYLVTISLGIPENPDWAFRVSAAAMTGLVFFGIASTLVNDSGIYRQAYIDLVSVRIRLEAALEASHSALASTRDRIVTRIREQLDRALRSSLDESERANPRLSVMTENLFSAVEGVVRPVSQELFAGPIAPEEPDYALIPQRVSARTVISEATIDHPIKPLAYVLLTLLLTAPTVLFKVDLASIIGRYIIATVVIYALLLFAKNFLTQRLVQFPLWARVIVVTAVYCFSCFTYAVIFAGNMLSDATRGPLLMIYGVGLGAVVGWLLALITGMHRARISMLDELFEKNTQLTWLNARLQSELWAEQKRLAMSLHNNVQGMLLAAALKLRAAAESGANEEALNEVRNLVQKAIDFEFSTHEGLTLEEVISSWKNSWGDLLMLSIDMDELTADVVDEDPVFVGTFSDVLSEFTTNAIKHGKAKHVSVSLATDGEHRVRIVMRNDGRRAKPDAREGMGLSFMKSVTIESDIPESEQGFSVSLLMPLATGQ